MQVKNNLSRKKRLDLFNKHKRMALKFAQAYCKDRQTYLEDFKQQALLGLWNATMTFDSRRKVKFSAHAGWQIRAAMTHYYRKHKNEMNEPTFSSVTNEHIGKMENNFRYKMKRDFLAWKCEEYTATTGEAQIEQVDNQEEIALYFTVLKPKYKAILRKRYFEGKLQGEIGKDYNTSKESIRQQIERALQVIRDKFGITLDSWQPRDEYQHAQTGYGYLLQCLCLEFCN